MHAPVDVCGHPGLLDVGDAVKLVLAGVRPVTEVEDVPVLAAAGRVAAIDCISSVPLPLFDQSAVDGYGLTAADLDGRSRFLASSVSRIGAGELPERPIRSGETVQLLTGAPVPTGVAAVVMEEKVEVSAHELRVPKAELGQNIRRRGEDLTAGSVIVERGSVLDARHLAVLSACGLLRVSVRRPVRVGVLSTGNELLEPGTALRPGGVYDANRAMLLAMLASGGGDMIDLGRVNDHLDEVTQALRLQAERCDLIVRSGGVSGSDADYVVEAVRRAGGECRRLLLALKPGKPIVVGRIAETVVLSLPGNPVAAMVGALLFARPAIRALGGAKPAGDSAIFVRAAEPLSHRAGRAEYLPAGMCGRDSEGMILIRRLGRGGSARLRPLVLADGLACIPRHSGDVPAGGLVHFYPFKSCFGL